MLFFIKKPQNHDSEENCHYCNSENKVNRWMNMESQPSKSSVQCSTKMAHP